MSIPIDNTPEYISSGSAIPATTSSTDPTSIDYGTLWMKGLPTGDINELKNTYNLNVTFDENVLRNSLETLAKNSLEAKKFPEDVIKSKIDESIEAAKESYVGYKANEYNGFISEAYRYMPYSASAELFYGKNYQRNPKELPQGGTFINRNPMTFRAPGGFEVPRTDISEDDFRNMNDYKDLFGQVKPFEDAVKNDGTVYTRGYSPDGIPMWVEKLNDPSIPANSIRNLQGGIPKSRNPFFSLITEALNNTFLNIPSTIGTGLKYADDLYDALVTPGIDKPGWLETGGDKLIHVSDQISWNQSERQSEGAFNSWEGIFGGVGQVGGQLLQMALLAKAGRMSGLSDKTAGRLARGFMGGMAVSGFRQQADEMGISELDQAKMALPIFLTSFGVESLGWNYLSNPIERAGFNNAIKRELAPLLKDLGYKTWKEVPDAVKLGASRRISKALLKGSMNILANSKVLGTAVEEGGEEIIENFGWGALMALHDWTATSNLGGLRKDKLEAGDNIVDLLTRLLPDYNPEATKEKGLFSSFDKTGNLISSWWEASSPGTMEQFALGFIGGAMGGAFGMKLKKLTFDEAAIRMAMSGNEKEGYDKLASLHKKGKLGFDFININTGSIVNESDKGKVNQDGTSYVRTLNDEIYDQLKSRLDLIVDLKNKFGLNDPKVLHAMGNDSWGENKALKTALDLTQSKSKIDTYQKQLDDSTLPLEAKTKISTDLASEQSNYEKINKKYLYYTKPISPNVKNADGTPNMDYNPYTEAYSDRLKASVIAARLVSPEMALLNEFKNPFVMGQYLNSEATKLNIEKGKYVQARINEVKNEISNNQKVYTDINASFQNLHNLIGKISESKGSNLLSLITEIGSNYSSVTKNIDILLGGKFNEDQQKNISLNINELQNKFNNLMLESLNNLNDNATPEQQGQIRSEIEGIIGSDKYKAYNAISQMPEPVENYDFNLFSGQNVINAKSQGELVSEPTEEMKQQFLKDFYDKNIAEQIKTLGIDENAYTIKEEKNKKGQTSSVRLVDNIGYMKSKLTENNISFSDDMKDEVIGELYRDKIENKSFRDQGKEATQIENINTNIDHKQTGLFIHKNIYQELDKNGVKHSNNIETISDEDYLQRNASLKKKQIIVANRYNSLFKTIGERNKRQHHIYTENVQKQITIYRRFFEFIHKFDEKLFAPMLYIFDIQDQAKIEIDDNVLKISLDAINKAENFIFNNNIEDKYIIDFVNDILGTAREDIGIKESEHRLYKAHNGYLTSKDIIRSSELIDHLALNDSIFISHFIQKFMNIVMTSKRINNFYWSNSFNSLLKKISENPSMIAPSPEQVSVIKHVVGKLINPDATYIMKWENTGSIGDRNEYFFRNGIFVPGAAGSGKSTIINYIYSTFLDYIERVTPTTNKESKKILVIAPSIATANNTASNIRGVNSDGVAISKLNNNSKKVEVESLSSEEVFNALKGDKNTIDAMKNKLRSYDSIVYDEATELVRINTQDNYNKSTETLREILDIAFNSEGKIKTKSGIDHNIPIIMLADPFQVSANVNNATGTLAVRDTMETTDELSEIYRTNNPDGWLINSYLRGKIASLYAAQARGDVRYETTFADAINTTWNVVSNDGKEYWRGVYIVNKDTKIDIWEEFQKAFKNNEGQTVYVVKTKVEAEKLRESHSEYKNNIFSTELGSTSIQGQEFDYVFVNIKSETGGIDSQLEILRSTLVAGTRWKKFLMINGEFGYSRKGQVVDLSEQKDISVYDIKEKQLRDESILKQVDLYKGINEANSKLTPNTDIILNSLDSRLKTKKTIIPVDSGLTKKEEEHYTIVPEGDLYNDSNSPSKIHTVDGVETSITTGMVENRNIEQNIDRVIVVKGKEDVPGTSIQKDKIYYKTTIDGIERPITAVPPFGTPLVNNADEKNEVELTNYEEENPGAPRPKPNSFRFLRTGLITAINIGETNENFDISSIKKDYGAFRLVWRKKGSTTSLYKGEFTRDIIVIEGEKKTYPGEWDEITTLHNGINSDGTIDVNDALDKYLRELHEKYNNYKDGQFIANIDPNIDFTVGFARYYTNKELVEINSGNNTSMYDRMKFDIKNGFITDVDMYKDRVKKLNESIKFFKRDGKIVLIQQTNNGRVSVYALAAWNKGNESTDVLDKYFRIEVTPELITNNATIQKYFDETVDMMKQSPDKSIPVLQSIFNRSPLFKWLKYNRSTLIPLVLADQKSFSFLQVKGSDIDTLRLSTIFTQGKKNFTVFKNAFENILKLDPNTNKLYKILDSVTNINGVQKLINIDDIEFTTRLKEVLPPTMFIKISNDEVKYNEQNIPSSDNNIAQDPDADISESPFQKVSRKPKIERSILIQQLDKLKERTGVKYFIDNTQKKLAMMRNGNVWINTNLASADTAFHEYAHPFILAVKNENPGLYEKLKKEILQDSSIMDYVMKHYPEHMVTNEEGKEILNDNGIVEAMAYVIGEYASEGIDPTDKKKTSLWKAIKEFLGDLFSRVKKILGLDQVVISNLDERITLREIAAILRYGDNKILIDKKYLRSDLHLLYEIYGRSGATAEDITNTMRAFGTSAIFTKMTKLVKDYIKNNSVYAIQHPENQSFFMSGEEFTIPAAIERLRKYTKSFNQQKGKDVIINENGEQFELRNIDSTNIENLPFDRQKDFMTIKLGDDALFNSVIKLLFPDMNVDDYNIEKYQDYTLGNDLDSIDVGERVSSVVRWHLENIKLKHYENGKLDTTKTNGDDQNINYNLVKHYLFEIAQVTHKYSEDRIVTNPKTGKSEIIKAVNKIDAFEQTLSTYLEEIKEGQHNLYNNLRSFYDEYFGSYDNNKMFHGGLFSAYIRFLNPTINRQMMFSGEAQVTSEQIREYRNAMLLNDIENYKGTLNQRQKKIIERGYMKSAEASKLMNAMMPFFLSVVDINMNNIKATFLTKGRVDFNTPIKYELTQIKLSSTNERARIIENNFDSLFVPGDTSVGLGEKALTIFNGDKKGNKKAINIKTSGNNILIQSVKGSKSENFITISINPNGSYNYSFDPNITNKEVQYILGRLGVEVTRTSIANMFNNTKSEALASVFRMTTKEANKEFLAESLSVFLTSLYMNIPTSEDVSIIKKFVDDKLAQQPVNPQGSRFGIRELEQEPDELGREESIGHSYNPANFWEHIKVLSFASELTEDYAIRNFIYVAGGKKRQKMVLGSKFMKWMAKTQQNNNNEDRFELIRKRYYSNPELIEKNPEWRHTIFMNNPFELRLVDVQQTGGQEIVGRKGVKADDMTMTDYVNASIGSFFNVIRKGNIESKLPIPLINISDTNRMLTAFVTGMKNDPLVKWVEENGSYSVINNDKIFNYSIDQQFQYHAIEFANSLKRWSNLINSIEGLSDEYRINPKYYQVFDKITTGEYLTVDDIELLSNLSIVLDKNIIPVIHSMGIDFQSTDLIDSLDYEINKDTGNYQLGNATTFNERISDIFNISNFITWNKIYEEAGRDSSNINLTRFRNFIFRNNFKLYKDKLKQYQHTVPAEVLASFREKANTEDGVYMTKTTKFTESNSGISKKVRNRLENKLKKELYSEVKRTGPKAEYVEVGDQVFDISGTEGERAVREQAVKTKLGEISSLIKDKIGIATTMDEFISMIEEFNKQLNPKNNTIVANLIKGIVATQMYEKNLNGRFIINENTDKIARTILEEFNEDFTHWVWNPFYEGLFFAQQMVNSSLFSIFTGNPGTFGKSGKLSANFSKRMALMNKQGIEPVNYDSGERNYGIKTTTKVLAIRDLVQTNTNNKSLFEKFNQVMEISKGNDTYSTNIMDGGAIIDPLTTRIYQKAFGGKIGPMGDGAMKLTGDTRKGAYFPITEDNLGLSDTYPLLLQFMWGPVIYEHYMNLRSKGLDFNSTIEQLSQYVMDNDLQDEIIGMIEPKSVKKTYNSRVHNIDISDPNQLINLIQNREDILKNGTTSVDNRDLLMQLNPEQIVEENNKVGQASQLQSLIAIGQEKSFVDGIDGIMSDIHHIVKTKVNESINQSSGNSLTEKFFSFLKKLGFRSAENMANYGAYMEMLVDNNINAQIPSLRASLMTLHATEMNKGIKIKLAGYRSTQAPGLLMTLGVAPDGKTYTKYDYLKRFGIDSWNNSEKRTLNPPKYFTRSGIEITDADTLINAIKNDDVIIKPAELIASYSYFKQFGIEKGDSPKDITTIETVNSPIDLMDVYDLAIANKQNPKDAINATLRKIVTDAIDGDTIFKNKYVENLFTRLFGKDSQMDSDIAFEQLTNYFYSFITSLESISVRIPTTSSAYAFKGRIIAFAPDNSNVIYMSAFKNILDGSDYDIDQLTTIFRKYDLNEYGIPILNLDISMDYTVDQNLEYAKNALFEKIHSFYENPKNIFRNNMITDLSELRELRDKKQNELSKNKANNEPFSMGVSLDTRDSNNVGDDMISITANTIQGFSRLMRMNPELFKKYIPGLPLTVFDEKEYWITQADLIISRLGKTVQAAVDNAKEMILGYLKINSASANTVMAMIINGKNFIEIDNLLNNSEISRIIQNVTSSKSEVKKSLNIHDEALDRINKLQERLNEYGIKEYFKNDFERLHGEFNAWAKLTPKSKEKLVLELKEYGMIIKDGNQNPVLTNDIDLNAPRIMEFVEKTKNDIEQLKDLVGYYYQGQFISSIAMAMGIYQGLDVKDFDTKMYIQQLEDSIGTTLKQYLNGDSLYDEDGSVNMQKFNILANERTKLSHPKSKEKIKLRMLNTYKVGQVGKVVEANKNIYEYVKTLQEEEERKFSHFVIDKIYNKIEKTYLRTNAKARFFKNEEGVYYKLRDQIHRYLNTMFMEQKYGSKIISWKSDDNTGDRYNGNIGTAYDRHRTFMEFTDMILKVRNNSNAEIQNNIFLQGIKNNGGYLSFEADQSMSNDQTKVYREAYNDALKEISKIVDMDVSDLNKMFQLYQLAKSDFSNNKGNLSNVINLDLYEEITSFLSDLNEHINVDDEKAKELYKFMKDTFSREVALFDEALSLPDYLIDNIPLGKSGEDLPQIIYMNVSRNGDKGYYKQAVQRILRPDTKGYKEHYGNTVSTREGGMESIVFTPNVIYRKNPDNFNGYETGKSISTKSEVIRNASLQQMRDLSDMSLITEFSFDGARRLNVGDGIYIMGKKFYVTKVDVLGNKIQVMNTPVITEQSKIKLEESIQSEFIPVPVDLSEAKISEAQKKYLSKDQYKSDNSNKFIGRGNGATGEYARLSSQMGKPVNSGNYNSSDVIFISSNGKRSGRLSPDLEEIQKAVDAGSSFLTDAKVRRPEGGNVYNIGEQEVAEYLREHGYKEVEEGPNNTVARWTISKPLSIIDQTNLNGDIKTDDEIEEQNKKCKGE